MNTISWLKAHWQSFVATCKRDPTLAGESEFRANIVASSFITPIMLLYVDYGFGFLEKGVLERVRKFYGHVFRYLFG